MLSTQKYHDDTYLAESWILYGIGVFVILLRWLVRIRTVGINNFQGDDYLTFVVLACYTSDAVAVKHIQHHGSNVDWTKEEMTAMTDQERRWISYGSKLQFLCWYTYPTLMWALKGCMLFFFSRLTLGLDSAKIVKWMAYACGITYVIIILVTSCSCLPYSENWATIPYPRDICSTRFQDMYVVTILNVLTDAAMLCIPLPILWRLQVPLQRKLALGVMLLGGIFVIVAAIVRICMSLQASPSTMNINRWGIRETIAGILAINVPIIRPVLSKRFWLGGPLSHSGPSMSDPTSGVSKPRVTNPFRSVRKSKDAFEMLDPADRPPFNPDIKMGGTNTTVRAYGPDDRDGDSERDASDTASEDLIIQKTYGGKWPHSSSPSPPEHHEQEDRVSTDMELERGAGGALHSANNGGSGGAARARRPSEQHGGINVTTTYTVRPGSPPQGGDHVVPDFMRRTVRSPEPGEGPAELDSRVREAR